MEKVKDNSQFNNGFQRNVLDIPEVSISKQTHRYTRGSKHNVRKEIRTKESDILKDTRLDTERVRAAGRRLKTIKRENRILQATGKEQMEDSNVELKKLTTPESQECMMQCRRQRCRAKRHLAGSCSKKAIKLIDTGKNESQSK